ncbi:cyclohexanecarboxyl-CoA dehydrogenase [Frondihabitans sp. PAMC 28766]|uniref:acyl-CoA dehydrogenase family protein n=1 Tax=Frondihabitans sp. PAMC 28766 TaxID=1795630 RepID=UPI00078B7314|nr:acyl-CoA dehydrogenase family protein [Frondihabitans sp. PAMC 28766]AMM21844.1 cyclohexanecarboxyl-CoA dehydrogenase [Frondihabitans sp. PAMC 28766]
MSTLGFTISEDQEQFARSARDFGVRRLAPFYKQREREGAFDRDTLLEMGEMGFFGVELPEEFGGLGLDAVTAGLVLEALSESDFNIGQLYVTMSLAGTILAKYCDPEIAAPWLEGLVRGEYLPGIGLTEPQAGSDAGKLAMRAVRDGDSYVLSGEKNSVTFAKQASFALVWARTGTVESRARGISAFLVPLDLPGITATEWEDIGGRAAGRGTLYFDDVRVPASHLIGEEGRGFAQVMQGFDYSRALIGIQCLAVARISLAETWVAAAARESFGKPLTSHQGVAFPLAEAETLVHACRLMCLETLWLKDNGLPHTTEAAMCKWWAPKLAFDVVQTCLLTNGHGGYSSELPYEQRLRDVLGLQIGDGMAQIMKMVIARAYAGRETA